jgi:lysophospholipase L1-like esterase
MKRILYVALAPILIIQGLLTKARAVRLPEPEGNRSGVAGSGETLRILILGDSAAAGVGVTTQEKALSGQVVSRLSTRYQVHWHLEAETGRTTKDTLKTLQVINANSYDVVLISLGVNDVTSRIGVTEWLGHCAELANVLQSKFSAKRIIWSDLPDMEKFTAMPQPLRWVIGKRKDYLRNELANWISQHDVVELLEFPDIFGDSNESIKDWIASDGYHPGEKVYALWAQALFEHI